MGWDVNSATLDTASLAISIPRGGQRWQSGGQFPRNGSNRSPLRRVSLACTDWLDLGGGDSDSPDGSDRRCTGRSTDEPYRYAERHPDVVNRVGRRQWSAVVERAPSGW